jgi:hypothetical protein
MTLNFKTITSTLFLAGLVFCSTTVLTSLPASAAIKNFICERAFDGSFSLKAVTDKEKKTDRLISFRTTVFQRTSTPERACKIVSENLLEAVKKNEGTLKGINLVTGGPERPNTLCYFLAGKTPPTCRVSGDKNSVENIIIALPPKTDEKTVTIMLETLVRPETRRREGVPDLTYYPIGDAIEQQLEFLDQS